jgi:aspartate carbamoyltransferase regulatory subunit
MSEDLKVSKIRHGTVIDHIRAGMAPRVLKILGIEQGFPEVVVMAMNVRSQKIGFKDIVKLENQFISDDLVKKIAIVAPQATVNTIKEYKLAQKREVELPAELFGIIRCPNRNCVTNSLERVPSRFTAASREPVCWRCHYCEILVEGDSVESLL